MAILALLAGVMGVTVISSLGFTVSRLGVAAASVLSVSCQLMAGVLLDHFGLIGLAPRSLNPARVGGALLLLAGAWPILGR